MHLGTSEEPRRSKRCFASANPRALYGQWEKNIGIAHVVMVEEIPDLVVEVIHVERPAAPGNVETELKFLVPLPVQWNKPQPLLENELLCTPLMEKIRIRPWSR
jgi:hypothetical protein